MVQNEEVKLTGFLGREGDEASFLISEQRKDMESE
jgi:hypothetical protein